MLQNELKVKAPFCDSSVMLLEPGTKVPGGVATPPVESSLMPIGGPSG